MSDSNIERLITFAYMAFCIYMGLSLSKRSFIADANNHPPIPKNKSTWDIVEIISKLIASVGAVIYAISRFYN